MKISIVQYSPVWEEPEKSIDKISSILSKDAINTDLIIFPEMTLTGFTMRSEKFAEEIDGISTKFFSSISDKFNVHILAGIIEKDEDKIFNSLIHFDDKGLITARYRKIHPFSYAKENNY